jgi:outer membrane protein OmpA-like peptidoglycan-associated protein
MHAKEVIPGMIRARKRRPRLRIVVYAILILVPIFVWLALMEAYVAYVPGDEPLQDRGADSIVALPNGSTLLEPRGTVGRNIADWLDAHPQGVQSFEVGGNQFVGDTAELTPESVERIGKLAAMLKADRNVSVAIIGHSATEADDGLSQDLALGRARRVRDELIQSGVPLGRISAESRGASDPIAPNNTGAGRQQNERVGIVLVRNQTND